MLVTVRGNHTNKSVDCCHPNRYSAHPRGKPLTLTFLMRLTHWVSTSTAETILRNFSVPLSVINADTGWIVAILQTAKSHSHWRQVKSRSGTTLAFGSGGSTNTWGLQPFCPHFAARHIRGRMRTRKRCGDGKEKESRKM